MDKTDRRILRTRRLLGQALLELIQEKSFDDITIRDITERADANVAGVFALIAVGEDGIERARERTDGPVGALATLD